METKNIIIIGILCIIICIFVGAIFGVLTNNVDYERIEITPNGTTIEIPKEQANYDGEVNETGAKLWTFKQGSLMTFNSEEAINARGLYGLGGAAGVKSIQDLILNHFERIEKTDGYDVYVLDGGKLGIENRGTLYCIMIGNDTTHDNIIIVADSKDIALHMAKSVIYKIGNVTVDATNASMSHTSSPSVSTNDDSDEIVDDYGDNYEDSQLDHYETVDDGLDYSSSGSSESSNVEVSTDESSSSSSNSEAAEDYE